MIFTSVWTLSILGLLIITTTIAWLIVKSFQQKIVSKIEKRIDVLENGVKVDFPCDQSDCLPKCNSNYKRSVGALKEQIDFSGDIKDLQFVTGVDKHEIVLQRYGISDLIELLRTERSALMLMTGATDEEVKKWQVEARLILENDWAQLRKNRAGAQQSHIST